VFGLVCGEKTHGEFEKIPLCFCPVCHKYWVDFDTYEQFRIRYGLPYFRLKPPLYENANDWKPFAHQSVLASYGYTVGQAKGRPRQERQNLLAKIMDANLMRKTEISAFLKWLIHTRSSPKYANARQEWSADAMFVDFYQPDRQRSIWVKDFIPSGSVSK